MLLGQPQQHPRVTPSAGSHWLPPAAGSSLSARGIAGRSCLQLHKYAKQRLTALKKLLSGMAHRVNVVLSPAQPSQVCVWGVTCALCPVLLPSPPGSVSVVRGLLALGRTRLGSGAVSCSHRGQGRARLELGVLGALLGDNLRSGSPVLC